MKASALAWASACVNVSVGVCQRERRRVRRVGVGVFLEGCWRVGGVGASASVGVGRRRDWGGNKEVKTTKEVNPTNEVARRER